MADLGEAFNITFSNKKSFQNLDYFFTQRTLNEDQEYFDKNLNRKNKKIKVTHNFLTINIPTILSTADNNHNKPLGFDIEIFGDEGYHYKGSIMSFEGTIPNFTIPIQNDKKLFININYNFKSNNDNTYKKFINFIEIPKRYQNVDNKTNEEYETNTEISNY
jgi:hypothetical protein